MYTHGFINLPKTMLMHISVFVLTDFCHDSTHHASGLNLITWPRFAPNFTEPSQVIFFKNILPTNTQIWLITDLWCGYWSCSREENLYIPNGKCPDFNMVRQVRCSAAYMTMVVRGGYSDVILPRNRLLFGRKILSYRPTTNKWTNNLVNPEQNEVCFLSAKHPGRPFVTSSLSCFQRFIFWRENIFFEGGMKGSVNKKDFDCVKASWKRLTNT